MMTRMTTQFPITSSRAWPGHRYIARLPAVQWLLLMLLLALSSTGQALPIEGLYSQEIVVENQSEAARERAYREAFEQVIVKVTGERRWLEHPRIREARQRAASYVAEVSYRTVGLEGRIDVRFDQGLIGDLLNQAEIPVWDSNRASVLLWITVQGDDGRRNMLGSSSDHVLLDQAREFATERGVPVLIPLLDLTDRRMVSVNQGWQLDTAALRQVGERYGADSVLAGRLLITPANEVVGLWQFIFRDQTHVFDHVDVSPDTYMDFPLDQVTGRLAEHFGLVPSDFEQEDQVTLRIDGVASLASHMALMRYLESLTMVSAANVSALRGDSIELRLQLAGTRQHLAEFISLGRDLVPVTSGTGDVATATSDLLHYRWTRQ